MQLSLVMHSETLHFVHIFYPTALFILVQRIDFRKKQHILDSGENLITSFLRFKTCNLLLLTSGVSKLGSLFYFLALFFVILHFKFHAPNVLNYFQFSKGNLISVIHKLLHVLFFPALITFPSSLYPLCLAKSCSFFGFQPFLIKVVSSPPFL